MRFPIPFPDPDDGWTDDEKYYLPLTIVNLYRSLKNPQDMFILMCIKEIGYSEEIVGQILGLKQEVVSNRLKKIYETLWGKKCQSLL